MRTHGRVRLSGQFPAQPYHLANMRRRSAAASAEQRRAARANVSHISRELIGRNVIPSDAVHRFGQPRVRLNKNRQPRNRRDVPRKLFYTGGTLPAVNPEDIDA